MLTNYPPRDSHLKGLYGLEREESRVPKSAKEVHLRKKRTERICYLERVHSRRFFHSQLMHLSRKYLNKNRHFIDQLVKEKYSLND